jgi:FkbM family methyltransferase
MRPTIEEPWLLPFLDRGAPPGTALAFDIGANEGDWTKLLATRCGHVVSVEPDARAFAELASRARPDDLAVHAAAFSYDGSVNLFVRPNSVQSSLLELHPIGAGDQAPAPVTDRVSVSCLTLDSLAAQAKSAWGIERVDFVKIDVEGAEGDVLAGATSEAFQGTRWLIEIHDRRVEVAQQLARLGFTKIELIRHPSPSAHPGHYWFYAE